MMSAEHSTANENEDSVENFMRSTQFHALTKHFESILDSLKEKEELQWVWAAFEQLLTNLKAYYVEIEQKTHKILELRAKNAVELQKTEHLTTKREETEKDLRSIIQRLQKELDVTNEVRRKLWDENKILKKDVEMEDKGCQVQFVPLDFSPEKSKASSFKQDSRYSKRPDSVRKHIFSQDFEKKELIDESDIKALKSDLNILVAGLKIAQQNITALKVELQSKDNLINEYTNDLSEKEAMLDRNLKQMSEIKTPLQTALKKYKIELDDEKKKCQKACRELREALEANAKQSADVKSKESEIDELKAKFEELAIEKDYTARKVEVFERHLAQSHVDIAKLEEKIQTLHEETKKLEEEIPTLDSAPEASKEDKMDINVQERLIESLKSQIYMRDKKLQEVGEKLNSTIEVLHSLKADFNTLSKDKLLFEADVKNVKSKLKERNKEIKELKDKLKECSKETEETRNKLYSWIKKYNQIREKKDKFHSLYNHMKSMNSQRKNENQFLAKRQQYLVNILKDKDKEIETLVSWRRYVIED